MNNLLVWQVAGAKITKIPEQQSSGIPASSLFPQWDRQTALPVAERLEPDDIDIQAETLALSTHSWLIEREGKVIIIDTASGNDKNRPGNPKFHQMKSGWLHALRSAGITPEQVDAVVLTHLHVDHVGWNTIYSDGEWIPTFPNARYYFSAKEYTFYKNPANVMQPSMGALEDSVLPVVASGQAVFIDNHATEVFPGLHIHRTPGHSVDHLAFSLSHAGQTALFWGDIAHSPLQVSLPQWNSCYCESPDAAQQSRMDMLNYAAETGALVFTTHFPDSSVGKVISLEGQLNWQHA
ncbi:MBL fold metallo-hydrolase [Serratia quinivorans]|uniref:MBL fold metallo-hydrolase n=1 Tax=Serratia quinivorans TaxID=137545 RepID=UPI003F981B70